MIKFKKALRMAGLILLLMLALIGIGMGAPYLPRNREEFSDKEVMIEMVDDREADEKD